MNLPSNVRVLEPSVQDNTPNSIEAEKGVLGSMMLSPQSITEAVYRLEEDYFYPYKHQLIYRLLVEQWTAGQPTDYVTLTQLLRDKGVLENVGGVGYVTELFTFVPTSANIAYYIDIVRDKYILRKIIQTANEGIQKAHDQPEDVASMLDELELSILKIGQAKGWAHKDFKTLVDETMDEIMKRHELGGSMRGIATGLKDLDAKLGGLKPSGFTVLAGETGEGKTALALSILDYAAITDLKSCGIISLEMSSKELVERMVGARAMVDLHEFYTHGGDEGDIQNMIESRGVIENAKIEVRDDPDITISKLRSLAREMKYRNKIEFLVIDYLQLLSFNGKDENRERQLAGAAEALKQCAKELDIQVLAISQVNDQGQLRESRAIGHHADVVIQIVHEDMDTNVVIRKHRSGPTGMVPITFLRKYAKFVNAAKIWQRNEN